MKKDYNNMSIDELKILALGDNCSLSNVEIEKYIYSWIKEGLIKSEIFARLQNLKYLTDLRGDCKK